jgi:drug/metabolite transporter (DMT)-like permease
MGNPESCLGIKELQEPHKLSLRTLAILQALFVVFLWATSWIFIKIGLNEIPPIIFAGLRYFLAFIILLVALLFGNAKREIRKLPSKMWWQLVLLGILFYTVTQGAIFVALDYLPAITVNLLWSFSSVIIAVMGFAWLSEKPTLLQWGGIGLVVVGAIIYFFPVTIPLAQLFGVLVAVMGILANALSAVMGRGINRSRTYPPLIVTVVSMGSGSIVLLISSLFVEGIPVISLNSWLIIIWLAIVNTAFAFTLWNHTLRTLTAIESSIINSTMLIWIPLFAVIFLGENNSVKGLFGLIAVALGTLFVQLRRFPPKKRASV